MKPFSVLLLVLFLAGCTTLCPPQKQPILQDQQSFGQAFDDFQRTHRITKLQKFTADNPDSIWADRAETIMLYSQELDQRKVQVEKFQESKQQQTLELENLKMLNQKLTEMIEQLKTSLIQSEKHPK